ncbi:hypothetical protein ACA135_01370 [Methanobrevibacter acididurans]|uniref:hypothetical protein n=1 Tax=Methanobrevibacter acididurans TaxID=120963 RepID=UPI0038FC1A34
MNVPYSEKEQDKKVDRIYKKLTETSSKKVSHSSKDIYDLIDKFNLKNDNVLKKREKEEDAKIDEIYEKLRIRAKN